jgi:competence protein ComEC
MSKKLVFSLVFILGLLLIYYVRLYSFSNNLNEITFKDLYNQKVETIVSIISELDRRESNTRLVGEIQTVNSLLPNNKEKILIIVNPYLDVNYGDVLSVKGKLQQIENFKTDTGRTFDYVHYLAKDKIFYEIYLPEIEIISRERGNIVYSFLYKLKNLFLIKLSRIIPEPELSLLGGLLLGAKQSLGKELLSNFVKVGAVHIVVVSGYNITILYQALFSLFSLLPRVFAFSVSGIGILFFVIMTGAEASSVRAMVMAFILILAQGLRRTYLAKRALITAGIIMILFNPYVLFYDPSFQLSFLATIGLLYVSPIIEPNLLFITKRFTIREIVATTLSIQIFLLPFILYFSGVLSIVALPVNVVILILVPLTMLLGVITLGLTFISYPLALLVGFGSYLSLRAILYIVETAASFRFAAVTFVFSFWTMITFYLLYTFILWKLHKKKAMLETDLPQLSN